MLLQKYFEIQLHLRQSSAGSHINGPHVPRSPGPRMTARYVHFGHTSETHLCTHKSLDREADTIGEHVSNISKTRRGGNAL